jgi:ribosome-associated translation inhibitor RaiA/cold shock CspA family protein
MQRDAVISWHNLEPSPAVEEIVRKRIAAIETFAPRAIGIRVTLDAPTRRKVSGRVHDVRIHLDMPGGHDLDVSRQVHHGQSDENLLLAVNKAFGALESRLKEEKRRMAGLEVKHHPPVLHGEIVELEPELGHGWLRADDGREVYFQKDGLVAGVWEALSRGDRLRFREQEGEKGAFAVDVSPAD